MWVYHHRSTDIYNDHRPLFPGFLVRDGQFSNFKRDNERKRNASLTVKFTLTLPFFSVFHRSLPNGFALHERDKNEERSPALLEKKGTKQEENKVRNPDSWNSVILCQRRERERKIEAKQQQ